MSGCPARTPGLKQGVGVRQVRRALPALVWDLCDIARLTRRSIKFFLKKFSGFLI
jgi:hypothetical protein